MSEEYNLKKSEKEVGQLLPVIKDAKGRIVDGFHRKDTDPEWREEVRPEIETDEDYWKWRAHLNYTRRNAQEARQEKIEIVNNLAEYYTKQGLKTKAPLEVVDQQPQDQHGGMRENTFKNEVLDTVINALDGAISESWVRHNIDPKYTQNQTPREPRYHYPPENVGAIEALERDQHTVKARYGPDFVERVKEEVRQEALKDPEFKAKIIEEHRDKVFSDITPKKQTAKKTRNYVERIESTFYKVRGWGVPMILSMGKEEWDKTLPYIQGIHDWTGFLLQIQPDSTEQPQPPTLNLDLDERRVIEAEYHVMEDKA